MADGSGADLQQYMKKDGDPTPFILFTNTIEPSLPETSENFLGIVEKRDWKGLVDLIKEVQSNNTWVTLSKRIESHLMPNNARYRT